MGSFHAYEILWHLARPLFSKRRSARSRSLTIGLSVLWVVGRALEILILGLLLTQQAYFEDGVDEAPLHTLPHSLKEVYLILLAGFMVVNQAELWAYQRTSPWKEAWPILLWSAGTMLFSWNQFFYGRPYPEEVTKLMIGIVSIYVVSLTSTVFHAHRRVKAHRPRTHR